MRLVAVDLRGHGHSPHRESYRYEDYVLDLLELLDELRLDRVAVAGHSLGGYVALLAAATSDRIERVVSVDVKSDWTDEDAAFAERSREAAQRVEPRERLLDRLARSVAPSTLAPHELEALAARSLEQVGDGWRFRWDRRVLATEPVDPFAFLGRVRCPVTVLAGSESDVMPPDAARRFAEAVPGATLELADGAGHHTELDAPELVARHVRALI